MNKKTQKELNESLQKYCSEGNFKQVKLLISQGADIHADDDYALRYSALNGHLEVVQYLVKKGADIHAQNDYALKMIALNGQFNVVKYLIEQGADIHAYDEYSLRNSVYNGHLQVVEFLFNKYSEDNKRQLAIDIINNNGNEEFIKLFNAKILSNKLHGDLNNNKLLTKKTKI